MAGQEVTAAQLREDLITVKFDGKAYRILGDAITVENLARFERKTITGDYTRDADDIISSIIWGDFSGGIGTLGKYNPGSDQSRFWFSRGVYTRDPFSLSCNRKVETYEVGEDAIPLGDLNGTMYAYAGSAGDIIAWTESTQTWGSSIDTLSWVPQKPGIEFGYTEGGSCVLWIPGAGSGYATFNGTAVSEYTDLNVVAFAEWDTRLWAISEDGKLAVWDPGTATWDDSWGQLDRRHTVRNLLVYADVTGNPTLWIITNKGIFAVDVDNRVILPANFGNLPPHPHSGKASAVWQRGGDLYYAAGTDCYRYSVGSTIAPMGPSRDDGLPIEYRGHFTCLAAGFNELWGLLQGAEVAATDVETLVLDGGAWLDDQPYVAPSSAQIAMLYWNGFGWHEAWSTSELGNASQIAFSAASDHYRVWWGCHHHLHSIDLPVDFHNPRQGLEIGIDAFGDGGDFYTGWYDAGMKGFDKIAAYLHCFVDRANPTNTLTWRYMTDFDTTWHDMPDNATLDLPGRRVLSFGMEGLVFDRIRFWLHLTSATEMDSPLLDSFGLYYVKNPRSGFSWSCTIPTPMRRYDNRTPAQVMADLDALSTKRGFVVMTHRGNDYRVRISQSFGENKTAQDDRGGRTVSIVHIGEPPDEPREATA
jgi:hypothetical protein